MSKYMFDSLGKFISDGQKMLTRLTIGLLALILIPPAALAADQPDIQISQTVLNKIEALNEDKKGRNL